MGKITNLSNVPLALAVWAVNDDYTYIDMPNYISCTSLMKPLRHLVLPHRVPPDQSVTEDVTDYIARGLGSSIHAGAEHAWRNNYGKNLRKLGYPQSVIDRIVIDPVEVKPGQIPIYMEQREFKKLVVCGIEWTIGGQYDLVAEGIVHDIKTTSTFTWTKGKRHDEHRLQGSLYKWLNPDKITADFIRICYVFTDWQSFRAKQDPNYPQSRCVSIDIPLMSVQETEQWVINKITQVVMFKDTPEPQVPPCAEEDLWIDPPMIKYYADPTKTTGRSSKNFEGPTAPMDAKLYFAEKGGKGVLKTILGKPKRCGYCAAAPICTQRTKYQ